MTTPVVTLPCIADMASIKRALQTSHNAFPVINTAGKLTGLMSRNFLIVILSMKSFYKGKPELEDKDGSKSPLSANIEVSETPKLIESQDAHNQRMTEA